MPPRSPRYPSLDAWRGIACLMVVVLHSTIYFQVYAKTHAVGAVSRAAGAVLTLGWLGVPLFFVISGYCIAATCDRSRAGGQSLWTYVRRRFRRIYPPYWIVLGAFLVVVLISSRAGYLWLFHDDNRGVPDPRALGPAAWIGNATLTGTWLPFVIPSARAGMFVGPAWTLCYEEQFYFLCGLFLLITRRGFFAVSAGLTALVTAQLVVSMLGRDVLVRATFLDGHWVLFGAGTLVYYGLNYAGARVAAGIHVALAVLALMGAAILAGVPRGSAVPVSFGVSLLVGCAFALMLSYLHRFDGRITRWRAYRPIAWVGAMTYSLYLVHWPIAKLLGHVAASLGLVTLLPTLAVTLPVCVAVSLLVARPFYRYVERRFMAPHPPAETIAIRTAYR